MRTRFVLTLLAAVFCSTIAFAAPTPASPKPAEILALDDLSPSPDALPARAQPAAGHQAALTWTAPTDAVSGSTYNVYRQNAACPATVTPGSPWASLKTGVTTTSYTDTTITVGAWCFYVTQVQAGVESAPSNGAGGTAKPNAISVITVIVQ